PDAFNYSVCYRKGGTTSTALSPCPTRRSSALSQSVSVNEGATSTVTLTGSDPDSDPLRFKITSLPAHGKLYDGTGTGGHVIAAGELPYALTGAGNTTTYQPTTGYFGPDAFQFKANDGQIDSTAAATVSISVN